MYVHNVLPLSGRAFFTAKMQSNGSFLHGWEETYDQGYDAGQPAEADPCLCSALMLGSLFQQFYNLADTIIVGRFVGVEALAAVGSVGGLNYLVLGFVNGIACGFSIPISWTFGAKDYKEMRRYTANTVWLSVAFAVVLTVVTVP